MIPTSLATKGSFCTFSLSTLFSPLPFAPDLGGATAGNTANRQALVTAVTTIRTRIFRLPHWWWQLRPVFLRLKDIWSFLFFNTKRKKLDLLQLKKEWPKPLGRWPEIYSHSGGVTDAHCCRWPLSSSVLGGAANGGLEERGGWVGNIFVLFWFQTLIPYN